MKHPLFERAAVIGTGVAAAAFALSGCSGASTVSSTVDPVAQAAQVSELAPGFKTSLSEEITAPGATEPVTGSGSGVFDQRDKRGAFTVHVDAAGHSVTTQAQYSDLALYMQLPGSSGSAVTHGKPWIKFDLGGVGASLGINFAELSGSGASSNPSQMLSYLRATGGHVTRVGAEQVQGAPTTRYSATIDYDRYASSVPPARRRAASQSVAGIERLTGSHTQQVEVWLDAQHRVRRAEYSFSECLPGTSGTTHFHMRIEFFDFGVQAIPAPPRSSEVADLTGYIASQLKHLQLGCH
jgi:hypothetical protein